ncbi:hypothetical protein FisN_9Lh175 [Fistulifera solaris]|uniref:Phosphoglycerate mutase family protein n=1 Tax=Fistulifera solaris TaxID=1519565 RepID=A0A1Z5KLI4_FISSO|nr:hypothetical protein FisN_9Lh175 [Fistulifera solaris]|eukprot:GAX26881.1 hypothetical protein FisN_9Lh175 [Fistulifera solaris]
MLRMKKGSARFASVFIQLASSCRGFQDWVAPIPAFKDATVGVRRIGFLRHGNTLPSSIDWERPLSEIGRQQAIEAGQSFGKELEPFHPFLLVSPAPRTMETARLFCPTASLLPIQSLYDGTMQPGGSAIFRKIGYAPLLDYLENENQQERELMHQLLGAYARETTTAIVNHLKETKSSEDCTLWIVGHAIYLPSAVVGLAQAAGFDSEDDSFQVALSTSTHEAEGYLVDFDTQSIRYLQRPSNQKQ